MTEQIENEQIENETDERTFFSQFSVTRKASYCWHTCAVLPQMLPSLY